MKDKDLERRIRHSLDAELSGLCVSASRRDRLFENAAGGEKVKRKLTYTLILTMVLILAAVAALAVALLSPQEVVEQVAVPLARNNDTDWRTNTAFSPEELAAFIRACSENGIDLEESHEIMTALRSGEGYDEEEAIMAVCRLAFGGNYGEWTLAQRHWFQEMMVEIGWADEVNEPLPGPDDLTEEEAREKMLAAIWAKYGGDMALEDREQFEISIGYLQEAEDTDPDGIVWSLSCFPRGREGRAWYTAALNKEGEVLSVDATDLGKPQTEEKTEPDFALTQEEAVHLAAEGIRAQAGRDVPLEDPEKYQAHVFRLTNDGPAWEVNFSSRTVESGFCSTRVDDATGEVTVLQADVGEITADNILSRYRGAYGWYDEWDSTVWAQIADAAGELPAETMLGRVVKATPWIAWREGLLTREQAEEAAFRQTGIRMGDVNCACLIDAEPNPVWKFRLLPWDDSYQDSVVAEIDAVTGEITDLDMYKSDYQELEPSFHMVTLHRIWARLELEENGPEYLARLAVIHVFSDMSLDMPEEDDLRVFDEEYWQPEIDGNTVCFRSRWNNSPDYQVTLDENGVPTEVIQLDSSGTEELPEDMNLGGNG